MLCQSPGNATAQTLLRHQSHPLVFGTPFVASIAGYLGQVSDSKGRQSIGSHPIVADQHRCYCFGTAFGQGTVGLQRALVVGMAHHAQFEGTLRNLPDTGMANQSSRGIGLSVRFAKIALRILCITLAKRGGRIGVGCKASFCSQ